MVDWIVKFRSPYTGDEMNNWIPKRNALRDTVSATANKVRNAKIAEMLEKGANVATISKDLGIAAMTVLRVKRRLDDRFVKYADTSTAVRRLKMELQLDYIIGQGIEAYEASKTNSEGKPIAPKPEFLHMAMVAMRDKRAMFGIDVQQQQVGDTSKAIDWLTLSNNHKQLTSVTVNVNGPGTAQVQTTQAQSQESGQVDNTAQMEDITGKALSIQEVTPEYVQQDAQQRIRELRSRLEEKERQQQAEIDMIENEKRATGAVVIPKKIVVKATSLTKPSVQHPVSEPEPEYDEVEEPEERIADEQDVLCALGME